MKTANFFGTTLLTWFIRLYIRMRIKAMERRVRPLPIRNEVARYKEEGLNGRIKVFFSSLKSKEREGIRGKRLAQARRFSRSLLCGLSEGVILGLVPRESGGCFRISFSQGRRIKK